VIEAPFPTVVLLGFLVGMRHALEADHLAAVATLARESRSVRDSALRGAVWGLGHTLTLFLVGGVVLLLGGVVPERFSRLAEAGVGAMLVVLGLQVFRRMHRQGVGVDRRSVPSRALVVGLVHGLAGSAALLLLAVETTTSVWSGLLYILVFGVGSIAGMAVLSAALAWPFAVSARWLTRAYRGLETAVGATAVVIGLWVLVESLTL
jgi:cytochrome c biogenesis protein CcdA